MKRIFISPRLQPCDFFPSRLTGERTNRIPFSVPIGPERERECVCVLSHSLFPSCAPRNIDLLRFVKLVGATWSHDASYIASIEIRVSARRRLSNRLAGSLLISLSLYSKQTFAVSLLCNRIKINIVPR